MKSFEIKLAKFHHDNRAHLQNLQRFIDSERIDLLPEDHKYLMLKQHQAMLDLDSILSRRMELLGLPL